MRLTPTVEWSLIGVLIVYIAFTPGLPIIRQILLTPIGRAAALAAILYIWKTVSPAIAALMLVSYMRCVPTQAWEGMEDKFERSCECPEGFEYKKSLKKCTNKAGDFMNPKSCSCGPGMMYNAAKNDCELSSVIETEAIVPPAPVALEAAASTVAPVGPTGATGATGTTGATGATGTTGATGDKKPEPFTMPDASMAGRTGTTPDMSVSAANEAAASGFATTMTDYFTMPAEKFSTYYPLN